MQKSKDILKKIEVAGNELDGNTSCEEEDDFLRYFGENGPSIFADIEKIFSKLDDIDNLIGDIRESHLSKSLSNQDLDKIPQLESDLNDATNDSQKIEELVKMLQGNLYTMHAFQKLCKRDEELETIEQMLNMIASDIQNEQKNMQEELVKNSQTAQDLKSAKENEKNTKLLVVNAENKEQ